MPLNNDYLQQIANSVGQGGTSGSRVLNNEYLRRIAEGIGGIVDPSSGKVDASKIEGVIPAANLPSYVDDVIEGYLYEGSFYTDTNHEYEIEPESGKIYVDVSDDTSYRWTGTAYVSMGAPYELPTMSASTKGGAKLGDGLTLTDGALGIDPEPQESTGEVRGAVSSLTAKGWATQTQTTGKNLYHQTAYAEGFSETINNTVFTYYESHIVADGTPTNNTYKPVSSLSANEGFYVTLPAGTYTASISGAPSDDAVVVRKLVDGVNQNVNNTTYGIQVYTFTLTEETKIAVAAACKKDVPHDNVTIGIQLELGSTATSYEPYTGSLPSPSPDWPQEIQVARGRNLISEIKYGKGITTAGAETDSQVSNCCDYIPVTAGATYVFSCETWDTTGRQVVWYNSAKGKVSNESIGSSVTAGKVLTAPAGAAYVRIAWYNGASQPQLELGSTPTPYVPYGHVGVNVHGRNLLDKETVFTSTSTGWQSYQMQLMPNTTYTISDSYTSERMLRILTTNTDLSVDWYNDIEASKTFKTNATALITIGYHSTSTKTIRDTDIQLELGSVAHPYQPCFNDTIPVPLPSKGYAAALPDGTADVLTIDGAGKVEWLSAVNEVVLDGSETWQNTGVSTIRYVTLDDGRVGSPTLTNSMCDRYIISNASASTVPDGYYRYGATTTPNLYVADSSHDNRQSWTDWLAQNPVTVLYPLATPTTEDGGYIDWPTIPDGAIITCPELDALGVRYLIGNGVAEMVRQWYERAKSEYESRLLALENAVAELATA